MSCLSSWNDGITFNRCDCRGNSLELETRNAVCDMLHLKYPFDILAKVLKRQLEIQERQQVEGKPGLEV